MAFSPSSKARLTRHDIGRFPGQTLFDRIAHGVTPTLYGRALRSPPRFAATIRVGSSLAAGRAVVELQ